MWRVIDSGPSDAFYNMAMDEAISALVRKGLVPPTLRFYTWQRPSITLGCFQKTTDINLDYCREKGIPVVRRLTGGRVILHGRDLTYSFSAKTDGHFSGGLLQSYRKISEALSMAMGRLGIHAEMEMTRTGSYSRSPLCFQSRSYGELSYNGRKLIGSAQRRWQDGFLQQGSIPLSMDLEEIKKICQQGVPAGRGDIVTNLAGGIVPLKDSIRASFEEAFGIVLRLSNPTSEEEGLAEKLLDKRYQRPEWNLERKSPQTQ